MCRRRRRGERRQPVELTDSVDPRKTSHRGRIGVSFHTDQLAGKKRVGRSLNCSVLCSSCGEFMNVLRCRLP